MRYIKIYESEEPSDEEIIENLLSILRKFINNAGLEGFVSYDDGCIYIQFILENTETMPSIMKVMKVINKLRTDILIQYECEFDLNQTTDDKPLITTLFYLKGFGPEKQEPPKRKNDDEVISDYEFPF